MSVYLLTYQIPGNRRAYRKIVRAFDLNHANRLLTESLWQFGYEGGHRLLDFENLTESEAENEYVA